LIKNFRSVFEFRRERTLFACQIHQGISAITDLDRKTSGYPYNAFPAGNASEMAAMASAQPP